MIRHDAELMAQQEREAQKASVNYDFRKPVDLETRVRNLISWWRYCGRADDGGSITIMADQLADVLNGPAPAGYEE